MTGSTLHDNYGYGLWFTSASLRTVVTDNTVTDNLRPGIVHDYAYESTIADNVVTGNGREPTITDWLGAGILIFGPDATVTGNTVGGNRDGITLVTHSGSLDGPRGLYIPSGCSGRRQPDRAIGTQRSVWHDVRLFLRTRVPGRFRTTTTSIRTLVEGTGAGTMCG